MKNEIIRELGGYVARHRHARISSPEGSPRGGRHPGTRRERCARDPGAAASARRGLLQEGPALGHRQRIPGRVGRRERPLRQRLPGRRRPDAQQPSPVSAGPPGARHALRQEDLAPHRDSSLRLRPFEADSKRGTRRPRAPEAAPSPSSTRDHPWDRRSTPPATASESSSPGLPAGTATSTTSRGCCSRTRRSGTTSPRSTAPPAFRASRSSAPATPVNVIIYTARPGVLVGRKGIRIDQLKAELQAIAETTVHLTIHEIKRPELSGRPRRRGHRRAAEAPDGVPPRGQEGGPRPPCKPAPSG